MLVPDYIRKLVPYVPGKPIEETQREFKLKRVIKLASNENPTGASPKGKAAAIRALKDGHRYPDASGFLLKSALSRHLRVDTRSLVLGNGSNEIIDLLVRAYCVPGDLIATSKAAFAAYKICAQVQGAMTLEAPLTDDLRFDLPALLKLVTANERVRMVFIPNPNNPTGTYVTEKELSHFLSELARIRGGSVLAVLDYAYWEYVQAKDLPDPAPFLKVFSNVVVLRTFSKIYGLASLRIGYGIMAAELAANLEKIRMPFNINTSALMAAVAALSDRAFVKRAIQANRRGMKFWRKSLEQMKVPYWPSEGNFLLIDTQRGFGKPGAAVFQDCLERGVIFRPVDSYGLSHALRISIGTDPENQFAVRVLRKLYKK